MAGDKVSEGTSFQKLAEFPARHFYRFRSALALLEGYQELEKQEIYFAPPEELNDPMEGFKDLYWQGDRIVWNNLIRHYILCLTNALTVAVLSADEYDENGLRELVFWSASNLPTTQLREFHNKVCERFFSNAGVASVPDLWAAQINPVRRDELIFRIRAFHLWAITCINTEFTLQGGSLFRMPLADEITEALNSSSLLGKLNHLPIEVLTDLEKEGGSKFGQLNIHFELMQLGQESGLGKAHQRMFRFVILNYPDLYVRTLDDLLFRKWYTACFVAKPFHAAMWGTYGDSHKGACLKFRATTDSMGKPSLRLKRITSWSASPSGSSKNWGPSDHRFSEMSYSDRFLSLNFFDSIGRFPEPVLFGDWLSDPAGAKSAAFARISDDMGTWRASYWKNFENITSVKFHDWKHEEEYRIILYSLVDDFADPSDRKLVYDFNDLDAIIFGIKMSHQDKAKIYSCVEKKCREFGRREFNFGQAYYSEATGKICAHWFTVNY